ncbi:uncharacterized protein LOC119604935 [Lucilia sericata]|uniref:uncharacterized protein LOC119604935 n=1 Tax=Lucilia sericata TaxID=13632 RepID=UPI0018A7F221|nr:uncharacterized protein LOC119604935 [Lucilia sericata]
MEKTTNSEQELRNKLKELQQKLEQITAQKETKTRISEENSVGSNDAENDEQPVVSRLNEITNPNESEVIISPIEANPPIEMGCTQLYGKNYEEDMVHLKDNIYCRKIVYDSALGSSFKASHLARRLIEGVFKLEAILTCTLSGQPPKAQGEERRNQKYGALNGEARKALTDFCTEYSQKRGWTPQTPYEINRTMTQKIGEIERQHKKTM